MEFDLLLLTRMSCQRKSIRDLTMMARIQRVFQDNLKGSQTICGSNGRMSCQRNSIRDLTLIRVVVCLI